MTQYHVAERELSEKIKFMTLTEITEFIEMVKNIEIPKHLRIQANNRFKLVSRLENQKIRVWESENIKKELDRFTIIRKG